MKLELGELHARHDIDLSLILEWQETSRNLERQCLQQQLELQDLKKKLLAWRKRDDLPEKQQCQPK